MTLNLIKEEIRTCKELNITNRQLNTTVLLWKENIPNNHVRPNTGDKMAILRTPDLQ